MIRRLVLITFQSLVIFLMMIAVVAAQNLQIENGLNYLLATQNPDGSWTGLVNKGMLPTTMATIETLSVLGQGNSQNYVNAVSWLQAQQTQDMTSSDYLSERIHALAFGGADDDLLLVYVDVFTGAWGGDDSPDVDNLDTALALQALKAVNYSEQNIISSALFYLTSNQNPDGGWAFRQAQGDETYESNVYMTALVLSTLSQFKSTYSLQTPINNAVAYLLTKQNPDGGFGEGGGTPPLQSPSTVYETALAFEALIASGPSTGSGQAPLVSAEQIQNAINYLTSAQLPNGSWEDDPYSTALALRALRISASSIPDSTTGTVTGIVLDASTNQPLNNVSVEAVSVQPPANTTTDNTGSFTLSNIPQGSRTITVSLAGYSALSTTLNITAGSISDLGTVALSSSPTTGLIRGAVTDASSSQPLEGATITVTGSFSASTATGANGSFIFTNVTPGTMTITASKTGYYTVSATGTVTAGMIINFNPKLSTQPPATTTGNLTGKILSASSNSPIQGAMILLSGGPSTATDAQGMFLINNIAPGIYQATISASGYTSRIYQVVITAGVTTDMQTIYLAPVTEATKGNLIGRVYDGSTNSPLTAASIFLSGGPSTATDTQGIFLINDIAPGTYQVTISATGYISQTSQVAIAAGITTNIQTVYLIPAPQTTKVTGRITDSQTGTPIANADVTVIGTGLTAKTDSNGSYTLSGISPVEFDIRATATGYGSTTYHVTTMAHGTFNVDISLNSIQISDLKISGITFSDPTPAQGETVTINAVIFNAGYSQAVDIAVRIYDGDPGSGGVQIGADQKIQSLLPNGSATVTAAYDTSGKTGRKGIYVKADPLNTVREIDETNNGAVAYLTILQPPDLVVQSGEITYTLANPTVDTPLTITSIIRNNGEKDLTNVPVRVYKGDPFNGGTPVNNHAVPVIPKGGRSELQSVITGLAEGSVTFFIVADPDNAIIETDESNNRGSISVTVDGSRNTDLSIYPSNITVSIPPGTQPGEVFTVYASVKNTGSANVETDVSFYLGNPSSGGALFGRTTLTVPAFGTQATLANAALPTGESIVYVIVDPDNTIPESNEANNTAYVEIGDQHLPDFVLMNHEVSYRPLNPTPRSQVTIDAKVFNYGGSADYTYVYLYDGDPEAGGVYLGSFQFLEGNFIDPYSMKPFFIKVTNLTAGEHELYIVADPLKRVQEINETNNRAILRLTVAEAPAHDVYISSEDVAFSPELPLTGSSVTIKATLHNAGSEAVNVYASFYKGNPSAGGQLLGRRYYQIEQESSQTNSVVITMPSGIPEIYIIADDDNRVQEVDESNNTASRTIDTYRYDLSVTTKDISLNPVIPNAGDAVSVDVTVHSTGLLDRTATLTLYEGTVENGTLIGAQDFTASGNQLIRLSFPYTYPGRAVLTAVIENISPAEENFNNNLATAAYGEWIEAEASNEGTDFWLAFPISEIYTANIIIQSKYSANVTVTLPSSAGTFKTWAGTVSPGFPARIPVDLYAQIRFQNDIIENKGIHITSDKKVSVLFHVPLTSSVTDDTYLSLPTSLLGTEHYIVEYDPCISTQPAEYTVIAIEDNTNIKAGTSLINLNRGQTYFHYSATDLTGTRIKSDKSVVVIASTYCSDVPQTSPRTPYCDTLLEQMLPVSLLGADYFTAPLYSPGSGEIFRILASQDNTEITINCRNQVKTLSLDAGEWTEFEYEDAMHIMSTEPISVMQYMQGTAAAFIGDPSQITIIPTDKLRSEYLFYTYAGYEEGDYITIVAPEPDTTLTLDGSPVAATWKAMPDKGNYAIIPLNIGEHVLTANKPVATYVYGYRHYGSYGYPAGFSVSSGNITVGNLNILPSLPSEGQLAEITATLTNNYNKVLEDVIVRIYNGDPLTGGVQIGEDIYIDVIYPGESRIVTFTWDTYGYSGSNNIYVVVDPLNVISESNEADNRALITIEVTAPLKPDPMITKADIILSQLTVNEGNAVTLSAKIRNRGSGIGNIPVSLYLGNPESGGVLLQARTIGQIVPLNGEVVLDFAVSSLGFSEINDLYVIIDPDNNIDELLESNNRASVQLRVNRKRVSVDITADRTQYPAISDVGINVYVKNEGMLPWSGTGDIYVEDTSGNHIALVATFTIEDLKPLGIEGRHFRVPITVTHAENIQDATVTTHVNFNTLFSSLGITDKTIDLNSLRVLEFDGNGNFIGEKNAGFEKDGGFDIVTNPSGSLLWHMDGVTPANQTRFFFLCFDATEDGLKQATVHTVLPQKGRLVAFSGYYGDFYTAKINDDGTFGLPVTVDTLSLSLLNGIVLTDLTKDGFPDIVVGDSRGDIYYYQNKADYSDSFFAKVKIGNVSPSSTSNNIFEAVASDDYNNDGYQDFIVNTLASKLYMFSANGDGTFTQKEIFTYPNRYTYGKASADLNNDGHLDLFIGDNYGVISVLFGNGAGSFDAPVDIANIQKLVYGLAVGDLDGDGYLDILTNGMNDGIAYLIKGKAGGLFDPMVQAPSLKTASKAAYALFDVNRDGILDVMATQYSPSEVFYYEGNGDGTYKAPVNIPTNATCATGISVSKTRIIPEITASIGIPEKIEGRIYHFVWNTGNTPSGNYRVHVTLSEGQGVIAEDTALFEILPEIIMNSSVTLNKISYNANEAVTITSTIRSTSTNYIMENLAANITIKNSQGTILHTETNTIDILLPAQIIELKTYWNTSTNPPGNYTLTLEVKDTSGAVLSTVTTTLTISSDINPSAVLKGQISVDKQSLFQGEPVNISYSVTNVGNVDLQQVDLSILTVHVVALTVYDTLTDQTSLIMDQSYANTKPLGTNTYSAKDYLVILRAGTGEKEETLASAYFRVEGAPSAPSLHSPQHGTDIETYTPELSVNNASDPNDDRLAYEFELYADSGLTTLIDSSEMVPEGEGITSRRPSTSSGQEPLTLQENAVYYWRARAYDGLLYGEWMIPASFRVNLYNDPPAAPTLSFPAYNSEVDALAPLLVVNNASDPDSGNLTYNFEIALDPDFLNIIVSEIGVFEGQGTTSWQVPLELMDNTRYYWRSQADDWLTTGPWMTTAKFFVNTANDAPDKPVIISPPDGSEITTPYTDIVASNTTDLENDVLTYIFQLDTVNTFDSPDLRTSGNVPEGAMRTSWPVEGLPENAEYYARVKASDGLAESDWSEVVRFFANTVNEAPSAPVLANPSNGAGVNIFTPVLSAHNSTDPDRDTLTYEFELYGDQAMTNLVSSITGVEEGEMITGWKAPVTLMENRTYYWQARAFDGELYSAWMPAASFTVNTANDAPTKPTLHAPAEGSSLDTLYPTLSVHNAEDPDRDALTYDFEIYSNGVMTESITGVSGNVSGITSVTPAEALTDNTTYTWKARAYDGDRYGEWMDTATFSVHLPVQSITATIDFDPNTLNQKDNGKWVTVYIELPGGYSVNDVIVPSLVFEGTVPVEPWPYAIGDYDSDGIPDLKVKFNRAAVINILPAGDNVRVLVTGTVGTVTFEGVDAIRVIH